MSQSKDQHEAERWYQTASEDLRVAHTLRVNGMYAHACFQAQQCAEKAVKALWYWVGQDPWGHSIQKLVQQFPVPSLITQPNEWQRRAAALDKFYIPTRYPNGLPDLTPSISYFLQDADQAIDHAEFILAACGSLIQQSP